MALQFKFLFLKISTKRPGCVMVQLEETVQLVLPPSAKASLVDFALRKNADVKQVIGVLLGSRDDFGGDLRVRSCFPLETRYAVLENCRTAIDLHRCIFGKDQAIGFFCVVFGDHINEAELDTFKQFFLKEISSSACELKMQICEGKPVQINARYYSSSLGQEDKAENVGVPIKVEVECSAAEYNLCKVLFDNLSENESFVDGNARLAPDDLKIKLKQESIQQLDKLVGIAYKVYDCVHE